VTQQSNNDIHYILWEDPLSGFELAPGFKQELNSL